MTIAVPKATAKSELCHNWNRAEIADIIAGPCL
jgi:hypothetical protein